MTNRDKQPTPPKTQEDKDMQQDSNVTDSNRKDRPGTRQGQPSTNDDYDYRPDFGTSGGGTEYPQHIDGEATDQKKKRPPEGDKPEKRNQREDKYESDSSTK